MSEKYRHVAEFRRSFEKEVEKLDREMREIAADSYRDLQNLGVKNCNRLGCTVAKLITILPKK